MPVIGPLCVVVPFTDDRMLYPTVKITWQIEPLQPHPRITLALSELRQTPKQYHPFVGTVLVQ